MPKTYIFDGKSASLLWDEDTTAWSYFTNAPEGNKPNYYGCIPTIYRAVQMVANDVGNMPFIVKRGDEVVDSSAAYENTLGFLPNPRKLFSVMSMSIDLTGSAYGLKVLNPAKYVAQIKYCAASTITPEFNKQTGALEKFTRTINETQGKDYKPEEMLYWWLSDPLVEIGPPRSWPLKVALNAAGVLHNMDTFVIGYFERGMVRPTIISVDGNPPEAERERIEKWFDTFMSGVRNAFRQKVFKAGAVHAQQIGDGLDQLENVELTADKWQDIAHAFGIPYALL
jgi:phage portal protein BeeE